MEEKTQRQVHQERLDAVQSVLDYLLTVANAHRLIESTHMTGKDGKIAVTMSMWPIESRVRNLYFDRGIGLTITHGKNDMYAIEYDADTLKVIDTTEFDGERKGAGRIHFTYPGMGHMIEEAEKLTALIKNVHDEWNLN